MEYDSVDQYFISGENVSFILCVWKLKSSNTNKKQNPQSINVLYKYLQVSSNNHITVLFTTINFLEEVFLK